MRLCTIEGCDNKLKAKGYCAKHHQRYLRHGDPNYQRASLIRSKLAPRVSRRCDIEDCYGLHTARGLCRNHYNEWYKLNKE